MKITKRIVSIIISLMIMLSCVPMSMISVSAAADLTAIIDTGKEVTLKDTNGDGVYEIGNPDELYAFAAIVNGGERWIDVILTSDIIVNEGTIDEILDRYPNNVREWTTIGTPNTQVSGVKPYGGTFDGNNKTISGLIKIIDEEQKENASNYCGLFAAISYLGEVRNVTVANSWFNGINYVGSIAGWNEGLVTNCYNTNCYVDGIKNVGGIVGYNYYGDIKKCRNSGTICGNIAVGGILGYNYYDGVVENCSNTGSVFGILQGTNMRIGGIVGDNGEGTLLNSYNTGTVGATSLGDKYVGGVVGYNPYRGAVGSCYNIGKVGGNPTLDESVGGVAGFSEGKLVECCYLNTICNGAVNGEDVAGLAEAKTKEEFTNGAATYFLGSSWGQKIGTDEYPIIGGAKVYYGYKNLDSSEKIYSNEELIEEYDEPAIDSDGDGFVEIDNFRKLYWFATQVNNGNNNLNAILTEDIVVNKGIINESSINAKKWTPIGLDHIRYCYKGVFDGNGKTISGLYFNDSTKDYVGLFGYVDEKYGVVKNVGVVNSYFKGNDYVGGIAGLNFGKTENCYNTSPVNGNKYVGGLVGRCGSQTISNCFNIGEINGTSCVGGLIGYKYNGSVINSYNAGTVNGDDRVSAFVGYQCQGSVNNCYYLSAVDSESADAKTEEQFASGEVAYLLQGEQEKSVWGQNIGKDKFPVLGGDKVYYGYATPDSSEKTYNNSSAYEEKLGDIDLDDIISIKDATMVQEHISKITTLKGLLAINADFDSNGDINIKDATSIQMYVVGNLA